MKTHFLISMKNLMMYVLYLSILAFSACSDDEAPVATQPITPTPSGPSVLEQFQDAYSQTLLVEDIQNKGFNTAFTFDDHSIINVPNEEYIIIDSEIDGTPTIAKGPKSWFINGDNTDIPIVTGDTDLIIICIVYDINTVTIYLNNGNNILFNRAGEEEIFSFVFEAANNSMLTEDVVAEINGNTISTLLPEETLPTKLVATIGYRGKSLTVDNVEQVSGVTANDFTNPLTYTLTKSDGTTVNYTASFRVIALPKIYINTENEAPILDKENYVNMTVRVEDPGKWYTDGTPFEGTGGIRGRGNSTWDMPKKPYKFKLDKKANLLGVSTDKEWALLANYSDKTFLRNIVALKISEIVDMRWTPQSISVDLYLNDEYQGVYALTEHVKVSEERLDLDLADKTTDGDFLMELDFHYDEGERFKTDIKQLPIMFKDPDELTTEQVEYIKNIFNTAEATLYSDHFTDPENGYYQYIDIRSFVQYYIVQELSKNCDGNMRGSCYMAVLKSGIIEMPMVWDFDIAFGNAKHITTEQGADSDGPTGWYIRTCSPWFDQLFKDPVFINEVKKQWNALYPQLAQLPQFVLDEGKRLEKAAERNYGAKWEGGAGWYIHQVMWPNYEDRGDYNDEINFLYNFIVQRLEWLDYNINQL
ncbi:MAG TPA: CotH kinase family protein [Candidatus Phocaeicola gallistercoris]|nr:CotH kinase family protein [Candidatus Phocaeicola gallistercoris]